MSEIAIASISPTPAGVEHARRDPVSHLGRVQEAFTSPLMLIACGRAVWSIKLARLGFEKLRSITRSSPPLVLYSFVVVCATQKVSPALGMGVGNGVGICVGVEVGAELGGGVG